MAPVGKADALRAIQNRVKSVKISNMKDKRLSIVIDKPVSEAFEFTTNPANTSKWIDGDHPEETNETPPKLGTIW